MLHRRRWLAARFLAVGLLAATLYTVDSLASRRPAEARCAGNGNPVRSTFSYGGTVRVSETPVAGTCDGDNIYRGTLKDERGDGNCVSVWFWEASIGWHRAASTCGGTATFQWDDRNHDSRAYEELCIYNDNTGFSACGWGTQEDGYGVNYGY